MGDFKSGQQSDVNSVSKHGHLMGRDSDSWDCVLTDHGTL